MDSFRRASTETVHDLRPRTRTVVPGMTSPGAGVFATNAARRVPQRSEPTAPLA
ncbi:hypothetical protein ACFQWD_00510 [Micromonospora lupini]